MEGGAVGVDVAPPYTEASRAEVSKCDAQSVWWWEGS